MTIIYTWEAFSKYLFDKCQTTEERIVDPTTKKEPVLEMVVFISPFSQGGERPDLRAEQISAPWIRENKILLIEERSLAIPPPSPLRI